MSLEFVPMEHRVAFRETEEGGSSLPCRSLRGQKGGPNCNWALAHLRKAGDVLFFLNLLEPVALSDKAKKGMYRKFARLVDMRTTDEALAVLIWFAERGGLDPVLADRLYNRAERVFKPDMHSREMIANQVWLEAGAAVDECIHPLKDRTGREMLNVHPSCHPYLLDETYRIMYSLRKRYAEEYLGGQKFK